ncbi:MAG TPA: hypothetical protein VMG10_06565 [Gemmataceae bacterium]|nr:hypothetical protein [Gemmataceae bacterium]
MTPQPTASIPSSPPPTIHEAERASGPSGAVLAGTIIDFPAAVARRQAGLDVVVCGEDVAANRRQAAGIEAAVGPCQRSDPHRRAGPLALPHFQQDTPPPEGHTFYETANRKARKRP